MPSDERKELHGRTMSGQQWTAKVLAKFAAAIPSDHPEYDDLMDLVRDGCAARLGTTPARPVEGGEVQTACDRCTVGVMDATNPHLRGACSCECHSRPSPHDTVMLTRAALDSLTDEVARLRALAAPPAPEVTEAMVEVAVAEFFRSVSGPGGDGHAPRSHATAMRDAITAALRGGAK